MKPTTSPLSATALKTTQARVLVRAVNAIITSHKTHPNENHQNRTKRAHGFLWNLAAITQPPLVVVVAVSCVRLRASCVIANLANLHANKKRKDAFSVECVWVARKTSGIRQTQNDMNTIFLFFDLFACVSVKIG